MKKVNTNKYPFRRFIGAATFAVAGSAFLLTGCPDRDRAEAEDTDSRAAMRDDADQRGQDEPAREEHVATDGAAVTLHEERMEVEVREVDDGGVVLRREVHTEDVSETIELRHEEVDVTRLSPEEARERGIDLDLEGEMTEEEIYYPLAREEVEVETEVYERGVVTAQPRVQTERETVEGTVRREELDVQRVDENRRDIDQAYRDSEELRLLVLEHLREEVGLTEDELARITVEVEDDVVYLTGSAPSDEASEIIEEEVRSIRGVAMVRSDL